MGLPESIDKFVPGRGSVIFRIGGQMAIVGWASGLLQDPERVEAGGPGVDQLTLPQIILGSSGWSNLDQYLAMANARDDVEVGYKLELLDQHSIRITPAWRMSSKHKFQKVAPVTIYMKNDTDATRNRFLSLLTQQSHLLLDLLNTDNGHIVRCVLAKDTQGGKGRPWYFKRKQTVPAMQEMSK